MGAVQENCTGMNRANSRTLGRATARPAGAWTGKRGVLAVTLIGLAGMGCERAYITNHYYDETNNERDAEAPPPPSDAASPAEPDARPTADAGLTDAGAGDAGQTGAADGGGVADSGDAATGPMPLEEGAPLVNAMPADLALDPFGTYDNSYWFIVSEEEVARMNERYGGGGGFPIPLFNDFGDIYTPGGGGDEPTFAEHLLVTTRDGKTADYGKLQVSLVGESTGRPWTDSSLPNLKLDTNEFVKKNRLGGFEHIRFNNAVVGSIFREKYTLDFYRALGYPAPLAGYAWVSSSVWGADVKVPYVVTESYKRGFCKTRTEYFGEECPNMWEFPGDFGSGAFDQQEACQFSECDSSRVKELDALVTSTPEGDGFKAALGEWIDWDAFHEFQCLSWLFATGDDALHNFNNFVLAERADGKFQWLPYSVDISFGQDWYQSVPLAGQSRVASGCQSDSQCWTDTIATCEVLLDAFVEADPVARLANLYSELETAGMLRNGDSERYEDMKAYIERRLDELPIELEENRDGPPTNTCEPPFIMCGDFCELPEYCYLCDNNGQLPVRARGVAEIGIADPLPPPGGEPLPPPEQPEGDAGTDGDAGTINPGPTPNPCLPYIEHYRLE